MSVRQLKVIFTIELLTKHEVKSHMYMACTYLRWLETVSSTFHDLEFDGYYKHSILVDTNIKVSTNCPIIEE